VLESAGWHPGRDIGDRVDEWRRLLAGSDGFEMFPVAEAALREFGGLRVEQSGPGKECARAPFVIDPTLAIGEGDRFSAFELELGARLFPLGEGIGGHAFLAVAEDGRSFLIGDDLLFVGRSVEEGIAALVEGRSGLRVDSVS